MRLFGIAQRCCGGCEWVRASVYAMACPAQEEKSVGEDEDEVVVVRCAGSCKRRKSQGGAGSRVFTALPKQTGAGLATDWGSWSFLPGFSCSADPPIPSGSSPVRLHENVETNHAHVKAFDMQPDAATLLPHLPHLRGIGLVALQRIKMGSTTTCLDAAKAQTLTYDPF